MPTVSQLELHWISWRRNTLILPDEIPSTKGKDLYPVMDAFQRKHPLIGHYFNTGVGIDLQYLDSQIAEKVLIHFSNMGYGIQST